MSETQAAAPIMPTITPGENLIPPHPSPTKPRAALVTGGAGGLGAAIARNFLAEGVSVLVCDINPKLLAAFTAEVSPATYPQNARAVVEACDITSNEALDALFARATAEFGGVDYVVNNAGIMDKMGPAGEVESALWDKVLAVNLKAPAMITQRAVNFWVAEKRPGAIVNVASVAGTHGFQGGAAYTASKHGLVGLTKNTAAFYRYKSIRCNVILPGFMQTNIGDAFAAGYSAEGLGVQQLIVPSSNMPLVDITKLASLVSYLCSDASAVICNGAVVQADNGWLAGY